jgi:hypothetical protein
MQQLSLSRWNGLGVPVFASLFAPWQDKVTSINLISDWFQPSANVAASIVGPLSCFLTYTFLKDWSKSSKKSFAVLSFVLFLLSLIICFIFKVTIENVNQLPVMLSESVWGFWFFLYLIIFISLGGCMMATFRLIT